MDQVPFNPSVVAITGGTIVGVTISGATILASTISGNTILSPVISGGTAVGITLSGSTLNAPVGSGGTWVGGTFSGTTLVGAPTVTNALIVGPAVVGTASVTDATTNAQVFTPNVQANGTSGSLSSLIASRWVNSSGPPALFLAKSRGTAVNTHAVVANADVLGRIAFDGDDGTTFREAARIEVQVDDASPSATAMGGKIIFYTTPTSSVTPAAALTLDNAKLATFAGNITQSGAGTFTTGTGAITLNGNVVVTTGKTITAVSGIIFSNETLSTYDEGTWTPTIAGDSTAGSQTYTLNEGRYIRIGNRVFCDFNIIMSAKDGTTAGNIEVRGFPFTIKNTGSYRPSLSVGTYTQVTLTTGTQLIGAGLINTTRVILYTGGSAVAIGTVAAADITNTFLIYGTISYEI